jgi:acetoacetate decarboxylase
VKIEEVRKRAFAMPLISPAFPPGPYRFINREYLVITYRTDPAALEAVVPEPLTFDEPLVKYEFIRMPDSTGQRLSSSRMRWRQSPPCRCTRSSLRLTSSPT